MTGEIEKLVTIEKMADILSVKRSWLYLHNRAKGPDSIPRVSVGKYVRYVPADVLEWLKRKQA